MFIEGAAISYNIVVGWERFTNPLLVFYKNERWRVCDGGFLLVTAF
jgi:hypothetical protein